MHHPQVFCYHDPKPLRHCQGDQALGRCESRTTLFSAWRCGRWSCDSPSARTVNIPLLKQEALSFFSNKITCHWRRSTPICYPNLLGSIFRGGSKGFVLILLIVHLSSLLISIGGFFESQNQRFSFPRQWHCVSTSLSWWNPSSTSEAVFLWVFLVSGLWGRFFDEFLRQKTLVGHFQNILDRNGKVFFQTNILQPWCSLVLSLMLPDFLHVWRRQEEPGLSGTNLHLEELWRNWVALTLSIFCVPASHFASAQMLASTKASSYWTVWVLLLFARFVASPSLHPRPWMLPSCIIAIVKDSRWKKY